MNALTAIEAAVELAELPKQAPPAPLPAAPAFAPIGQITKAIADVMKDVHVVAKTGENRFHNYRYARMEDILKEITPLLGHHGIVIFQSEIARAMFDNENVIAIEYGFSVVHESGEQWPHQLRQTGVSRCRDSKGGWDDKALNKCHTAARKYFLLSLFQVPTGDEADADKGENDRSERRRTLPKKDARDIFNKLREECDAAQSRPALREWMQANAERIKIMPDDWQDILRLRCEEKLADLRHKETAEPPASEQDADGVVWEETAERPATAADRAAEPKADAGKPPVEDGIPPFLDRRTTPGFDPYKWLAELQTGLLNCEDVAEVHKLCSEHVLPVKKHIATDMWKHAQVIVTHRISELGNTLMAAE